MEAHQCVKNYVSNVVVFRIIAELTLSSTTVLLLARWIFSEMFTGGLMIYLNLSKNIPNEAVFLGHDSAHVLLTHDGSLKASWLSLSLSLYVQFFPNMCEYVSVRMCV